MGAFASICENTADNVYATFFFAEYDDKERLLRYSNCGHLSGLLLRGDNTLERLDSTGTVLGLFSEWDCSIAECKIFSGDTLVLYTDGVTESFNRSREEFGEDRLVEALRRNHGLTSEALVKLLIGKVQDFSSHQLHDDITLMVARGK